MDNDIDTARQLIEVTFDEAMAIAIAFQKHDQLAEAERLYTQILEVEPNHPGVLHHVGLLAHQQGRSEEAIRFIERSLDIAPDRADCYSNLGIILRSLGRLDDAIVAYRRAIELAPQHANAHNNLGVLLRAIGKPEDAEAEYRKAIEIDAEHLDAYHNLGVLLAATARTHDALICFCKVRTLSPSHKEARRLLALAHCTLGQMDKAAEIFRTWLTEEPDNPVPRHMLAACSRQNVPDRASDEYIEIAFDDFASTFDEKLAYLSYQAPQILAAMLGDRGAADKTLDILDAGCGTGLCGPLVAPFARTLVGVDLSAQMLAKAEQRGVYDELVKHELTSYLQQTHERFDVVLSADTLVYFGRLDEVVQAAAGALRPGGWLLFTVEEAENRTAGPGFEIVFHGRYHHTREYVERVLAQARLQSHIVGAELRMESGLPVKGLAVRALKGDGEHGGLA